MKYENLVKEMNKKFSGIQDFENSVTEKIYADLQDKVKTANVASRAIDEGIDAYFNPNKIKISSIEDLFAFNRVSKDTLVHKSTRDLWSIEADGSGEVHITRLFDNSTGEPLKV